MIFSSIIFLIPIPEQSSAEPENPEYGVCYLYPNTAGYRHLDREVVTDGRRN